MELLHGKIQLFMMIYLAQNAQVSAQDNLQIVAPFPENIYALEFSSAHVTCVAFDSTGIKVPDRIKFARKNQFAEYTILEENNNLHFTNMTELVHQGGKQLKKIMATMYIKNITLDDDSIYGKLGRYECHAFADNDNTTLRKHGFSVNVIRGREIPTIHVTKPGSLQHGQNYVLRCNVTSRGSGAPSLKKISWFKNGFLLESVRLPDPNSPEDFLKPIMITDADVKDGGVYTCLLEVLVRGAANFNVTDSAMVTVSPWFDEPKEDIKVSMEMGDKVSFKCGAKGFPLEVEWRLETHRKNSIQPFSCISSSDEKYEITGGGITNPYILMVSDLQHSDSGFYYCCFSSNCSSCYPNKDNCQRFILDVSEKSGSEREVCDTYLLLTLFVSMIMMYTRNQP
ncbi:uncharacterized protein LOC114974977 isoform X2 [Acropora millepora]|uniref:uncharacterized protein LOC114974977 isoform X2 n=1 Tax=Acropora millepora TaxID=45264 RepID=UPI001CF0EDC0|nr:uncharacterized protein LOC114974977 isoform X2 [Acropora millepora]